MDNKEKLQKVLNYKSVSSLVEVEEYIKENPKLIAYLIRQLHFDRNLCVIFCVDDKGNTICYTKTNNPTVQFEEEKWYVVYKTDEEIQRQSEEKARNKAKQRKDNKDRNG